MRNRDDLSESPMCVRKTVLKDIIKAYTQTIIEDVVCKSNIILKHTTLFLKLYLLYVFEKKEPFPTLNKDFIGLCMKVVSKISKTGRPPNEGTKAIKEKNNLFL